MAGTMPFKGRVEGGEYRDTMELWLHLLQSLSKSVLRDIEDGTMTKEKAMDDMDKAEEMMNKIRDQIDHDRLKGQIVARHTPALLNAMKALPSDELVSTVVRGLNARHDLTARQIMRIQHQLGTMLMEALRDDE